jgi:hypothetical protein
MPELYKIQHNFRNVRMAGFCNMEFSVKASMLNFLLIYAIHSVFRPSSEILTTAPSLLVADKSLHIRILFLGCVCMRVCVCVCARTDVSTCTRKHVLACI